MKEADIANALGQRLQEDSPIWLMPIVWENKVAQPERPYLSVEMVRTGRTDDTLDGTNTRHTGFMQVTVVSDRNKFTSDALAIADDVAAQFPYGLRLPIPGGEVVIIRPPLTQQSYQDKADLRTPVRIDYETN